jgi:D-glycero-D-manno-heptose 1,7-bisphosphate phosphatase
MHRAVFLDRDGTINEEMGYINHLSRFQLLPGAAEAIARLNRAGFKVVVVTNQSGVARKYFPQTLLEEVHRELEARLAAAGARLDGIYVCSHAPDQNCACRKPRPGLLLAAARDLDLDLSRSYLVGDRYNDLESAANAGVQGILVLTGYGRGEVENYQGPRRVEPVFTAADLGEAADWIIAGGI